MYTSAGDQPFHDTEILQKNEERHQWISFALILLLLMVGGFVIFLSAYYGQAKSELDIWIIPGLIFSALALILAFVYFFAFRFFDQFFYLFISIAWTSNALYLPFESFFDSKCAPGNGYNGPHCLEFSLYTYAISFISSISFYLTTLTRPKEHSSYPTGTILLFWAAGIILTTAASYILLLTVWPNSSDAFKFAAYTLPGMLFSAYSLFKVGQYITGFLKDPKKKAYRTLILLSVTFHLYGALQLSYPFKLYIIRASSYILLGLFIFAFGLKFINVYCLVKVLLTVKYPEFVRTQAELEAVQERLNRQTQLAAIGAIAASIEHDIKNPLSGISTKLVTMRRIFSDNRMRNFIDRLEEDKNRIAAIARVVPYMRGDQEFYDRAKYMSKVSINQVISRAAKAVRVEMSLNPDKFHFPISQNAPKGTEFFVRAYSPMIESMVVNLFKNGIEAIREAGKSSGAVAIRIATTRTLDQKIIVKNRLKNFAKWVKIEIEDNGCGIPAENIPLLTSLFTTKNDRKANGGIGLFIAQRLIRIHDGYMEISSVEGKGTTVTIYLPEWDAYEKYVMEHPEQVQPDYDFAEDINDIHISAGDQQQDTPAVAK
ncbi:MAG TPA: ATP-binding protein [Pyrinomonadaceae bacterium]|jgi:signal transduction histidine kinase